MCDIVVKMFTFAISSPDEFLYFIVLFRFCLDILCFPLLTVDVRNFDDIKLGLLVVQTRHCVLNYNAKHGRQNTKMST